MTDKAQKKSLGKKLKRLFRSPAIIKLRRQWRKLQKRISPAPQKPRLTNPADHNLEAIFVGDKRPKSFLSLSKIAVFVIIFLGVGGSYLWLSLNQSDKAEHEIASDTRNEATKVPNEVKIKRLADKEEVKAETKPETTIFTLQPYSKSESTLSLIRTINPHFLIQAAANQKIKVAILVVGVGINQSLMDEIIEQAPKNVSLVFSPYTPLLEDAIEVAQLEGFSTLVAVPLEDEDPMTDQGYLTIQAKADVGENQEKLKRIVLNAHGADCFYGQGGARLLRFEGALRPVFSYLKEVNNCFVAPPDILLNKLHEVAANMSLNYVCTTIENPSLDLTEAIEALAKRTGFAIVAFDARSGVLDEIKQWIKNLEQAKLSVVPITEIIHS